MNNNSHSLVCICVPTYNAAATIRETLESILRQTHANLVIHISDNASTDKTLEIVRSFADSRVHIHCQEKNIGAEANFNCCIQLAEGTYTGIFHADDIYEPDMVAKQVAFFEVHPEVGAVFTEAYKIDETSRNIGEIRLPQGIISRNGVYDFATMFKAVSSRGNFFICPSFMVRTQIYQQEIKVWRGDMFGSSADLDVWLRILQNHPIGHIAERLIRYRVSKKQFSAQVRRETEKSLLFQVLDHYLEKEQVRAVLNSNDLRNYKWLERRNRVMRALNLFLIDHPQEAGKLLNDIYSQDALSAAFHSKQGLQAVLVGAYIKLLVATGLNKIGKSSLAYLTQVTNR